MCSKLWRAEGSTISRSQLILSKHSVASFCSPANAIKIKANAFLSPSPLLSKAAHLPALHLKHMWVSVPFAAKGCCLHQPPGSEAAPPLTCACLNLHYAANVTDCHSCRAGTTLIATVLSFFLSPFSGFERQVATNPASWGNWIHHPNKDRTRVKLC